jgi:hypothetical protein
MKPQNKPLGRPKLDAKGTKVEIGTVTLTAMQAAEFERLRATLGSRAATLRFLLENSAELHRAQTRPAQARAK